MKLKTKWPCRRQRFRLNQNPKRNVWPPSSRHSRTKAPQKMPEQAWLLPKPHHTRPMPTWFLPNILHTLHRWLWDQLRWPWTCWAPFWHPERTLQMLPGLEQHTLSWNDYQLRLHQRKCPCLHAWSRVTISYVDISMWWLQYWVIKMEFMVLNSQTGFRRSLARAEISLLFLRLFSLFYKLKHPKSPIFGIDALSLCICMAKCLAGSQTF